MKNKISDLNNHLFAQLERLNDETLSGDKMKEEIARANAITSVSKCIVDSATLELNAIKLKAEYKGLKDDDIPQRLAGNSNA